MYTMSCYMICMKTVMLSFKEILQVSSCLHYFLQTNNIKLNISNDITIKVYLFHNEFLCIRPHSHMCTGRHHLHMWHRSYMGHCGIHWCLNTKHKDVVTHCLNLCYVESVPNKFGSPSSWPKAKKIKFCE